MSRLDKNSDKPETLHSEKEQKDVSFGVHDFFLLLFYLVIIGIGASLILRHGENAGIGHMAGVSLCLCGITTLKFSKYRSCLREHLTELVLLVVLFGFSLFALFVHLL